MMKIWTARIFTVAVLIASTAACGKDDCITACEKGRELCGTSTSECEANCADTRKAAEAGGCLDQFEAATSCIADSNNLFCTNGVWGSPDCQGESAALSECGSKASTATSGAGGSQSTTTGAGGSQSTATGAGGG